MPSSDTSRRRDTAQTDCDRPTNQLLSVGGAESIEKDDPQLQAGMKTGEKCLPNVGALGGVPAGS
jgi:hypothetical protein